MEKKHVYVAKTPDAQGYIDYTADENQVWQTLYTRQSPIVAEYAHPAYLEGLAALKLSPAHVPQCEEITQRLRKLTGWSVVPVKALISFKEFFTLLSERKFPAASFIRIPEELDYLQEPDIFHEIFGHCPLLANPDFANFTQAFGRIGLQAGEKEKARLARLYWFTAEFGLMKDKKLGEYKIYGAGILSSKSETIYAATSPEPVRLAFDLLTALRTPYRYDLIQTLYYVIEDYRELYEMVERDLLGLLREAKALGDISRTFDGTAQGSMEMDCRSC